MIDLHQLRVFTLVAERRSFSAAADELLLSQPTVSSHIRRLEESLGTPLLHRLPRGVEPTAAGEILLRYSRELLKLHQDALDAVREHLGTLAGDLAVGGSSIPGEYLLPRLLGKFHETAPDVRLLLRVGDSQEVADLAEAGRIDLGMVGAHPGREVLDTAPFCGDELVAVVSPSHPLAARRAASAPWSEALAGPLWLREPGSGTRQALERALRDAGASLSDLRLAGQFGSTEAVKQAVMAGGGVTVVSSLAVAAEATCKRLWPVKLEGLDLRRSFFVIRHRHRSLSPAARALSAFLDEARKDYPDGVRSCN